MIWMQFNSLTLERSGNGFTSVFPENILWIDILNSSLATGLNWVNLVVREAINDMSTLIQAMARCCQATSQYLSQYWPDSLASLGHKGIINQHLRWNSLFQVVLHPGQQVPDGHTLLGGNVAVSDTWFEASSQKKQKVQPLWKGKGEAVDGWPYPPTATGSIWCHEAYQKYISGTFAQGYRR